MIWDQRAGAYILLMDTLGKCTRLGTFFVTRVKLSRSEIAPSHTRVVHLPSVWIDKPTLHSVHIG